jgi:protein-tyrosine phosphatase
MKILMVCLGNICRSPIAEGVMKSKFDLHNIKGTVDSAGVLDFHAGEHPDTRATTISFQNHIDISKQIARQFRLSDLDNFDLILAMDHPVYESILKLAGNHPYKNKIHNFLIFAGNSSIKNVPDPYYCGPEGFEIVFEMIDKHCEIIAQKIALH